MNPPRRHLQANPPRRLVRLARIPSTTCPNDARLPSMAGKTRRARAARNGALRRSTEFAVLQPIRPDPHEGLRALLELEPSSPRSWWLRTAARGARVRHRARLPFAGGADPNCDSRGAAERLIERRRLAARGGGRDAAVYSHFGQYMRVVPDSSIDEVDW